jgi:uncharacterized membrane protein YebE (DUF533 family)
MGLMFRRRRPLMRLAAGAAVGTAAYQAGKRHQSQDQVSEPAPAGAPPAPVAASPPANDTTSEIERLASLHMSGALTDAEFAAAKAQLLGI